MIPTEIFEKRILISPLNWGMGHVARCIPLIKLLKSQNNSIFLVGNRQQITVFKDYFGESINYHESPGYPFYFGGKGKFTKDLLIGLKKLSDHHYKELSETDKLVNEFKIDLIISDHRYSFRSKNCMSIFLTHQLHLPIPFYQKIFQILHKKQISKFDFQWIVEDEQKRLAGKLSNPKGFTNANFIGYLSRFSQRIQKKNSTISGLLIISGPDSYSNQLIEYFLDQIKTGEIECIVGNEHVRRTVENYGYGHIFKESKNWRQTDEIIYQSKKIFGYCGYSTLMDLEYLNCDSELIPCKGQLEHLYLKKKS